MTNFTTVPSEDAIKTIVAASVKSFSEGFHSRHEGEYENPEGTINKKIHNVFIAALGPELKYYSALVRSLDSSLGNMLEKMALEMCSLFYEVHKSVEGVLYSSQTQEIATLLEAYKRRDKVPSTSDYVSLRNHSPKGSEGTKRHESDYYLIDKSPPHKHFLIELKIGGDLDNKKARSEKEAILEQYCILSNTLAPGKDIKIYFATAYNRFGENNPWKQERVRQFFADDELLIGRDFWNFICKREDGYNLVLSAYKDNCHEIINCLDELKSLYIGAT